MTVENSTSFYQDAVEPCLHKPSILCSSRHSRRYHDSWFTTDHGFEWNQRRATTWIHISRRLKMEVGSPSTPSLEGRGLSCHPAADAELMVAFWLGNSPLMAWSTDLNFQWDNADSDTFNGVSIVFLRSRFLVAPTLC